MSNFLLIAQKHDYIWVTGDSNLPVAPGFGGSIINFNNNPVSTEYHFRNMNFRTVNSSICDANGNLKLYTNGCDIAGSDDLILDNGNDINPGFVHDWKCHEEGLETYITTKQSALFLPVPGSDSMYYLFHKRLQASFNPFSLTNDKLFYSVIDMSLNNGKGRVIAKNMELMNGPLSSGDITAVKHANGVDWWIVTAREQSPRFYIFRLTEQGITDTLMQDIGIPYGPNTEGGGQVVFSPDGTRMFRTNPDFGVNMFDFDRATGIFSNHDTIQIQFSVWQGELWDPVEMYCAVSPNGRYLYLSCELWIYQFDLWAPNIGATQTTVATWDGFVDPIGTTFGHCQLGPDCKIYIATIDSKYYHVIHHPDEAGLACDVEQRGLLFEARTGASMPNFPNFRLGPAGQPGLPCSPVVASGNPVNSPLPPVSVFPNPATDRLVVVLNQPAPVASEWRLYNSAGQLVQSVPLDSASDRYEVQVAQLPEGLYFYHLGSAQGVHAAGKVWLRGR